MKLTKEQSKKHDQALELIELARDLTDDEKEFLIENYHEGAESNNTKAGAHFTPSGLAFEAMLDASGDTLVDLCAGIGSLAYAAQLHCGYGPPYKRIVCVEINPSYVKVGRKVVPEAEWICSSVFDLPDIGRFDCAVSNPPFGRFPKGLPKGAYTGSEFEYHVIEAASKLAKFGVFILPQGSCPFRLSGRPFYDQYANVKYDRFAKETGITLAAGVGVDTSVYKDQWRSVSVVCEIAKTDFVGEWSEPAKAKTRKTPRAKA